MAGSSGEIAVDLRLKLQKLQADIQRAARMMRDGLARTLGAGGGSGQAVDAAARGVGRMRQQMEGVANAAKRAAGETVKIIDATRNSRSGAAARAFGEKTMRLMQQQLAASSGGNLATAAPILTAQTPIGLRRALTMKTPVQPPTPPFMRRSRFFQGSQGGAGGAVIAGASTLAKSVVGVVGAFLTLRMIVNQTSAVFERARQLYARSLTTGLGLQFTAQRSMAARVLGVSEMEIFNLGTALQKFAPKLEFASTTMAKLSPVLAETTMNFSVLKENLKATASIFMSRLAPALNHIIDVINGKLTKGGGSGSTGFAEKWGDFMKNHPELGWQNPMDTGVRDFKTGSRIYGLIRKGMKAGPLRIGAELSREEKNKLINEFAAFTASTKGLGQPTGWMKQLPAGSLERMGLVMGGRYNASLDYQKRAAVGIEKLVSYFAGGVARASQFGMAQGASNP